MAFDGVTWNESAPDNTTAAHEIDDYNKDLRKGIRARMALEHVWSSSQTATNEAGYHKYITLQPTDGAPTMAGTTAGAIWVDSSGLGLYFTDSAGTDLLIAASGSGLNFTTITGGTQGSIPICSSASAVSLTPLAASAPGLTLHTNTGTGNPTWEKINLSASAQITGTGIAAVKAYDSGWFAITTGASFSKTHNLNSTNLISSIYFSTDAAGANCITPVGLKSSHTSPDRKSGMSLKDIDSTGCKLQTGITYVAYTPISDTGDLNSCTGGYARIVLLALD